MNWYGKLLAGYLAVHGLQTILRPLHDRLGASSAELDRPLPGDERTGHVDAVITRAVAIDAPATAVWPWLVQMGFGRAGWYSHDLVDNLGRPSADRIIPAYQSLAVGDLVPSAPFGIGFRVLEIESFRHLVLGASGPGSRGTWAFVLEELGPGRTRLVERIRGRSEWWSPLRWLGTPADLLDLVMMRKHLEGVKRRAESATRGTAEG